MSLQSFSCIEKIKSTGATYMAASGLGGDNHIVIIIFPAPITVYNVHPTLYILKAGKVGFKKIKGHYLLNKNSMCIHIGLHGIEPVFDGPNAT